MDGVEKDRDSRNMNLQQIQGWHEFLYPSRVGAVYFWPCFHRVLVGLKVGSAGINDEKDWSNRASGMDYSR